MKWATVGVRKERRGIGGLEEERGGGKEREGKRGGRMQTYKIHTNSLKHTTTLWKET